MVRHSNHAGKGPLQHAYENALRECITKGLCAHPSTGLRMTPNFYFFFFDAFANGLKSSESLIQKSKSFFD